MNASHRFVIKGACVLVCGVLCWYVGIKLTGTSNIVYAFDTTIMRFDPLFSSTLNASISSWFETHSGESCLYTEVKKQFPCIAAVNAYQKIAGKTVVCIKASCPKLGLNIDKILTADYAVVPRDYFDSARALELPVITMHALQECSSVSLMNTLCAMVQNCSKQFEIVWVNKTCVWLKDTMMPSWHLLVDAQSFSHDIFLPRYQAVQQAMTEKIIKGKKVPVWVADMRFADQIIVYGKRGVDYEAS